MFYILSFIHKYPNIQTSTVCVLKVTYYAIFQACPKSGQKSRLITARWQI